MNYGQRQMTQNELDYVSHISLTYGNMVIGCDSHVGDKFIVIQLQWSTLL